MRSLVLAYHLGACTEVVLLDGEHPGLHWGKGLGLPGASLHPTDALAPRRGDSGQSMASAVAALRGLFVGTGLLLADAAAQPDTRDIERLREAFARDIHDGSARFADLGLAWQVERVERLAVRRARGDALREDATVFAVAVQEHEARLAGAASAAGYLARWAVGDVALADFVPALLRRADAQQLDHALLEVEDAQEPAPGIRMRPVRSPTLPPASHTNMFLVGGRTAVLIEPATPFPDELDAICQWVAESIADGTRVLAICATHHHPDHIGGAVALRERLGLPLWAHAKTAEALAGRVAFDALLEDGQRIELALDDHGGTLTLECVHTPGHAFGHLCFFEPRSRALIAGDMIAGVGSILVEKQDGDMGLYLESLERMRALGASCLLPAHGGVIVNPEACLQHYVTHRLAREEKVAEALGAVGEGAPVDLLPRAYADTPHVLWPLAARAIEAHLIHLQTLGRAQDLGDGRYRKTPTT